MLMVEGYIDVGFLKCLLSLLDTSRENNRYGNNHKFARYYEVTI